MSAPTDTSAAPGAAQGRAEALTLLDALARAPAAAALVVAALGEADRKALRLVHFQLCAAVGEATTKLEIITPGGARPPTARRWPRLEELTFTLPDLAALEALALETWGALRTLRLGDFHSVEAQSYLYAVTLDAPAAHALAAALPRMPALRALEVAWLGIGDAVAAELICAASANAPLQLRSLTLRGNDLTPVTARALAATGWRLEELNLQGFAALGGAGLAALIAAPTFALRRLSLKGCRLDAASVLNIANAPWPLEELDLSGDLSCAAAGPALAALSQHAGLRRLNVTFCQLSNASFKALVEAAWPALTSLNARYAKGEFSGPHALGAAAFAGFPALEELDLAEVELGEAGARRLASRRWPRLRVLNLFCAFAGNAGVAALARGGWPALEELSLGGCDLSALSARFLARGSWRSLRRLDLMGNRLGDYGSARLCLAELALGVWPALEWLGLYENDICVEVPTLEEVRRWAPRLRCLEW